MEYTLDAELEIGFSDTDFDDLMNNNAAAMQDVEERAESALIETGSSLKKSVMDILSGSDDSIMDDYLSTVFFDRAVTPDTSEQDIDE